MSVEEYLDCKYPFEGRRVKVRVDTIKLPSGRETTREIVEFPDCVAIVAIDSDDNVLLVRQYRTAVGKMLLEIPAGKVEPDEHHFEAMQRELREETGCSSRQAYDLGGFYSAPGYSTEYLHLYLATDLVDHKETPDTDEISDVFSVPLFDIPSLIAKGDIRDAKSVAGLMRVIAERENLE